MQACFELLSKPIKSCHCTEFPPVTQGHHSGGIGGGDGESEVPVFGPPSPLFAPINNHACVRCYGICVAKNTASIQLAANKTNTTCHCGLSEASPPIPPSLPHPMLVCSAILFTFLLANYLSPLLILSGSRALSNRGSLSHSLIERLSGDYGEVRNKVVLRNHKHKPFLSLG